MVRSQTSPVDLHLLDSCRADTIAELEKKTWCGQNVALDRAPSPRAAVHGDGQGSSALAIEPATGDGIEILANEADGVCRVLGCHDHEVALP